MGWVSELNRNSGNEPQSLLPADDYLAIVDKARYVPDSPINFPYIEIRAVIVNGSYTGNLIPVRLVYRQDNYSALQEFTKDIIGLGININSWMSDLDTTGELVDTAARMIGQQAIFTIEQREYPHGSKEYRNFTARIRRV